LVTIVPVQKYFLVLLLTALRKASDTGYIPPPPFPHEKSTSQPGD
jgi:hypothetical protein